MGHGLSANTIAKANKAVERVLTSQSFGEMTEKRKYTTAFMPKDHASLAAENRNAMAVKMLKATFDYN